MECFSTAAPSMREGVSAQDVREMAYAITGACASTILSPDIESFPCFIPSDEDEGVFIISWINPLSEALLLLLITDACVAST